MVERIELSIQDGYISLRRIGYYPTVVKYIFLIIPQAQQESLLNFNAERSGTCFHVLRRLSQLDKRTVS
jgi:hypothetical protein